MFSRRSTQYLRFSSLNQVERYPGVVGIVYASKLFLNTEIA